MPTAEQLLLLLPPIFLVAALYSSVGHGGASGYLAVISLMGFTTKQFVPIILTLNVLVATISFLSYRIPGDFSFRKLLPFVVTSIPASFIGGMMKVSDATFQFILGLALIAAAIRLLMPKHAARPNKDLRRFPNVSIWAIGIPIGLVLGLVSGMIGIGGGVFLSPILLFLGITDIKGSAAMASSFIVLNSLAGLAGHVQQITNLPHTLLAELLSFLIVGLAGAVLGSRWGAIKSKPHVLQYVLAGVLMLASLRLVSSALF